MRGDIFNGMDNWLITIKHYCDCVPRKCNPRARRVVATCLFPVCRGKKKIVRSLGVSNASFLRKETWIELHHDAWQSNKMIMFFFIFVCVCVFF